MNRSASVAAFFRFLLCLAVAEREKLPESLFLYLKIQLIYRPNENNNGPSRERCTRQFQKLAFLHCGKTDSPTLELSAQSGRPLMKK
jgi:hypothetical protein